MKKIALFLALLFPASNALSATFFYTVTWSGDGDWMDASHWTDNGTSGDTWDIPGWVVGNPNNGALSVDPDWNNGYAHIDSGIANLTPASNPDGTVRLLYVGSAAPTATLNISDDLTIRRNAYMGFESLSGNVATINQTAGDTVYGTAADAASRFYAGRGAGNAVYNLSGGTMQTLGDFDNFGYTDTATFTFNQTGGTYTDTGTNLHIGNAAGTTGIVNLSNGTFIADNAYIRVGQSGHGEFHQSGGSVVAERIRMGETATASGIYSISGGSLQVNRFMAGKTDAVFEVIGSGATSIDMSQFSMFQDTFRVDLDAVGSTLIEVTGLSAETYHGASLQQAVFEVDTLAGFNGLPGDVYDILWSADTLTTTDLVFSNLSGTDFEWDVVSKNGGLMLQLTIVPEPTTILLLASGGLLFGFCRRQS